MSLAETAELVAELNLKGNFNTAGAKAQTTLKGLSARTADLQKGVGKVGKGLSLGLKRGLGIATVGVGLLTVAIKGGIDSLVELEDVQNQTEAVLRSTGGAAGQTAKSVRDMAQRFEDLTTVDDKLVQKGENVLLTFTNIKDEAFEPAMAAALDLSQAMHQDLQSSVVQVGKALNDPIKGLTALTRIGVSFTEEQKQMIKSLVGTGNAIDDLKLVGISLDTEQKNLISTFGDLADPLAAAKDLHLKLSAAQKKQLRAMRDGTGAMQAQKIILGELNREFGGSATNAAKGYRGQVNRLKDAAEDLQMSLARPLLRPLTRLTSKLAEFAKSKKVQDGIGNLGKAIADLATDENIDEGFKAIEGGLSFIETLDWEAIKAGFQTTADIAKKAVDIFKSLPPGVQTALVTLLAANKLTGGLVASGLKDIATFTLRSLTTINAANVTVVGASVKTPGTGGGPGDVPISEKGGIMAPILRTLPIAGEFQKGVDKLTGIVGVLSTLPVPVQQQLGRQYGNAHGVGTIFDDSTGGAAIRGLQVYAKQNNMTLEQAAARLNAIYQLSQIGTQATERVDKSTTKTAQLAPVSNDILDAIAKDQTTISENGKRSAAATEATKETAGAAAKQSKSDAYAQRLAQARAESLQKKAIPVFGDIYWGILQTRAAIARQKNNVTLKVTTTVSAVTTAENVTRVSAGNRIVAF